MALADRKETKDKENNSVKGNNIKYVVALMAIFLLVFGIQVYFKLNAENYSDGYSYYVLRNVQAVQSDFVPLLHDRLSSSARFDFSEVLFYYVLAFFGYIFGNNALWVFIALSASSVVFAAYLLAGLLTDNKNIALFSAFTAGFVPVFFSRTINSLSSYAVIIPGVFFLVYFLANINKKKSNAAIFALLFTVLLFINASAGFLVLVFFIYLLILKLEKMQITRTEADIGLFMLFFSLWLFVVLFKQALISFGYKAVWQNIPKQILAMYFSKISIVDALYMIGIIPAFSGLYAIYTGLFERKSKQRYVMISFALAVIFLLVLKLVNLELGLMFLGIIMAVLFADFFSFSLDYIKKTKFSFLKYPFVFSVVFFVLLTSVVASLNLAITGVNNAISNKEIDALKFLKDKDYGVVVASPEEGYLVEYFAKKKPILDYSFLFTQNTDVRYEDIKVVFTSAIPSKALELMDKYDARYIFFSAYSKKRYNITKISYIKDINDDYFYKLYNNSFAVIYGLKE